MKLHLLVALMLSALLWGCAAHTPYSETVIDTSTGNQQRGLPEVPVYDRPIYTPGGSSDLSGLPGSH